MAFVQKSPVRRSDVIRQLIRRDKTPLGILVLSGIVGLLVGLLGVGFEHGIHWITEHRLAIIAQVANSWYWVWPLAFLLSALLAVSGYYLVQRFAPEAAGSGIPEIEGALEGVRAVRWWRVIPVKFFGGLGTLGAGMVLGREGPTIQLGGNTGKMVQDLLRIKDQEAQHTLIATGAAAGLAAAFNAPLAAILFVIEEMRPHFHYNLISIKAVFIGVIMSTIVFHYFNGAQGVIEIGKLPDIALNTLWLYLLLGMIFGVIGVGFNRAILYLQGRFEEFYQQKNYYRLLVGALLGGVCGVFGLLHPEATGGGFELIPIAALGNYTLTMLLVMFTARLVTTLLCFCSGAPGGIFAPMLALGTLFGCIFGLCSQWLLPSYHLTIGTYAVAGMGALFAATVRAPLTGIVLVLEMTDNYQLILPMIVTCLGATLLAQFLGGKPLYASLLAKKLAKSVEEQADATVAMAAPTTPDR